MASRLMDLSIKKICTCSTLFCAFLCHCFARLQCMEELSYVLTKNFVSCVHVHFYFFNFALFHSFFFGWPPLAGRSHFSFSHRRYEIFMFFGFFRRSSSPLFSITRFSSIFQHNKFLVRKLTHVLMLNLLTEYFLFNGLMFKKSTNYLRLSMQVRQLGMTKFQTGF